MCAKRVCVIGNFSGRNAGDAAILGGLLEDISRLHDDVEFEVPTINTAFVAREFAHYRIKPIGLMPWNMSIKILGLPLFMSINRCDLVLVTDAILFDRKLMNPLYNYLWTMALALPWAHKRGKPVVLYNVSLGPVHTPAGILCLQKVIDASGDIILRDRMSSNVLSAVNRSSRKVLQGADCALNANVTRGADLDALFEREKLCPAGASFITVNINSYLDVFLQRDKRTTKDGFVRIMAETIDRMMETHGLRVVFVQTQPMDLTLAREVFSAVKNQSGISMITNVNYSYRDLAGVLSRADIHIGMRTHSLILAASVQTPVVGIACTPKNRGFMDSIEQTARMIEFEDFRTETFFNLCSTAWMNREAIRKDMGPIIAREKQLARSSATLLATYLDARH